MEQSSMESKAILKEWNLSCPGLYCGRTQLNASHVSACGPCPRGSRVLDSGDDVCVKCEHSPDNHDALFLLFHLVLVLVLHLYAIDSGSRRRSFSRSTLCLHLCAILETALAAILTVLVLEPFGQLRLVACNVDKLADWYPYLHNPQPNYGAVLYCTHEVVYPLMTAVFVFHSFCALAMLVFRPVLGCFVVRARNTAESVYSALYFLPLLSLLHGVVGGIIYFCYPLVIIVGSLITSAAHFAFKLGQTPKELCKSFVVNARPLVILLGHWLLHAFGILTLINAFAPVKIGVQVAALGLVPLPAVFYVATAKFTAPSHFRADRRDS